MAASEPATSAAVSTRRDSEPTRVVEARWPNDTVDVATHLCEQTLLPEGARSISLVGAATAGVVAGIYYGMRRDPRPWTEVAAGELVVQCDYTARTNHNESVFVDAAGHSTRTPTARPLP